jgi:hypothetical protein
MENTYWTPAVPGPCSRRRLHNSEHLNSRVSESLKSGQRELKLDLSKEGGQTRFSQSSVYTGQIIGLPEYENIDNDAENVCWESLNANFL